MMGERKKSYPEESMTQFSKIVQIVLAGALACVLIPNLPVAAASSADQTTVTVQPEATASSTCASTRTVQVTGAATVNVVPDRALIRLGVQSNATSIDTVESANSNAIQKVLRALIDQGVEAKDISTDVYVIEPVYENYDSLFIKGFRINNEVAITLRDIKKTSSVVSAALRSGANQVENVSFYTSELRKYRDQARELAARAAKEKAQALAAVAGAEAGCVISITENSWSYYNGSWYGQNQSLMTQNTVQNAMPSGGFDLSSDEPISLGQISVKAEISATYSLK
jgi:uncharacterized protein